MVERPGGHGTTDGVQGRADAASDASWPHHIPRRHWGAILRRVVRHVLDDRLMVLSAGISFFALLSIAPMPFDVARVMPRRPPGRGGAAASTRLLMRS